MADQYDSVYRSGEWTYEDYKQLTLAAKEDVREIRTQVYGELENDSDLGLFNSPSKTADWNLWADVMAFVQYLLHGLWTTYEQRLNEAATRVIAHNTTWYASKALEFQFGDSLVVDSGVVRYPSVDLSKRIVATAAVKENQDGHLIIKVAKRGGAGLEPLSSAELLAFKGYVEGFKDAGVVTPVVSQNPDLLRIGLEIYYNPIVPLATLRLQVESAIQNYVTNLPFDGMFRRTKLIDALQALQGIKDVRIVQCEASVAYVGAPNYTPVDVFYETVAGYMNLDPQFPLQNQITYLADA